MALAVPVYQDNGVVSIDTLRASAVVVDDAIRMQSVYGTSFISNGDQALFISSKQNPNPADPQMSFSPTAVNIVGLKLKETISGPVPTNIAQNATASFAVPASLVDGGIYTLGVIALDGGGNILFATSLSALCVNFAPDPVSLYCTSYLPNEFQITGGPQLDIKNLAVTPITSVVMSYYLIGKSESVALTNALRTIAR
jgi:hypothetical protein